MSATYVDANVLVYAFGLVNHIHRLEAQTAIERAADEGPVVTSSLAVDEFLWARRKESSTEAAISDGRALLAAPVLAFVPVDRGHMGQAIDHMARWQLKPRDATHLAVALEKRCARILTTDSDFDVVTDIEIQRICS